LPSNFSAAIFLPRFISPCYSNSLFCRYYSGKIEFYKNCGAQTGLNY
jgi:hypothetical protein